METKIMGFKDSKVNSSNISLCMYNMVIFVQQ